MGGHNVIDKIYNDIRSSHGKSKIFNILWNHY